MNKINLYAALFPLLLFAGCVNGSKTPEQWQKISTTDLNFMYQQIMENHPGPVNKEDPLFTKNLEESYKTALKQAPSITNKTEYWQMMHTFTKSFKDSHLRVFSAKQKKSSHQKQDLILAEDAPFYYEDVAPKVALIRIPTFEPSDKQKLELEKIIKILPSLRTHNAIIFDVHNNGGGDSEWGNKMIEALFSPEYAQPKIDVLFQSVTIDFRASPANLIHWKKLATLNQGWENLCTKMEKALCEGEPFVHIVCQGSTNSSTLPVKDPVKAKIIVIMNSHCFSACLDFIDGLTSLNHPIVLFGETTGADALYIDVDVKELPSKRGSFQLPLKVYRGRKRGNNIPYTPDVVHQGNFEDKTELIKAVSKLI